MLEQIYSPVRWTETAELFASSGIETIIECGPGKVLCGLNKKVSRSFNVASLEDAAGFEKALGMVE
jgi:[acyl-carrier-protein] S-malonyltransferase